FLEPTYPINNENMGLQPLLQSLTQTSQLWSLHQQAVVHSQLEELLQSPPAVLKDPIV
ncbi:16794_t:CDS:1, partial [Gigaspora rosea]